ncbi:MAG: thiol-disulfide oxidoreductase DCC family protein [Bacteroidota bacterium]
MMVLFYDNECLMCSNFVRLVYKYDATKSICFSGLNSDCYRDKNLALATNTVVFYVNEHHIYTEAQAIIELAKFLRFPFNCLNHLNILPISLLNKIYRVVARNRKIFQRGKNEKCKRISSELIGRVIK